MKRNLAIKPIYSTCTCSYHEDSSREYFPVYPQLLPTPPQPLHKPVSPLLLPLSLFGMRQEKKWKAAPSDPTWRASPEAEKPFVPPPHAIRVSRFWRAAIPKRGDIGVACVTRYKLFACYYCIGGTSVAATGTKADATTRSTDNIRRNTRVGFA